MSIRILHTADLHLGAQLKNFGELARERRRDFLKTFDKIVNLAIKKEANCLVISGDLFDSNTVESEIIGRVQDGFSRLAGRGIAVVLIPGTHDNAASAESIYTRYTFPDTHILMEPRVTEPLCLQIRGASVYFYGFAYRSDQPNELLAAMKRRCADGIHIGLLHGSLKGSPEWEMRRKDLPFSPVELAGLNLDYIALGHYHGFATIELEGRMIACYPGSPEGKKFGENGPRYVALVDLNQGLASLEKVEVQSRMLNELAVDASLFPEPGALEAELARLGSPDLMARIRLSGVVDEPVDVANLAGRLQGKFAWLDLIDETDLYDSSQVQRMEREDTIRGLFIRKVHERFEKSATDGEREICREALKLVMGRFVQGRVV